MADDNNNRFATQYLTVVVLMCALFCQNDGTKQGKRKKQCVELLVWLIRDSRADGKQ